MVAQIPVAVVSDPARLVQLASASAACSSNLHLNQRFRFRFLLCQAVIEE